MVFTSAVLHAENPFGNYVIDPVHSSIGFSVNHLVISTVEGKFNKFDANLLLEKKIFESKIEASVDIASLDTSDSERNKHLLSPDFFEASKYPKMKFVSTQITGSLEMLKMRGKLTIKEITRDIVFEAKISQEVTDLEGKKRIALSGTAKINRQDFGINWSKLIEAGPVVGDQVTINIKAEFIKKN